VTESVPPDLLPSVAQILKRAGALEREPGVNVQSVARLPVFQGRSWKRAIGEFLRWSGSTPEPWGSNSVFELLLCHGSAGARALFEAYRHDRLERAETFAEAQSQLEAVRTVISMAAYWLHAVPWDLRDAPRLSAEEFQGRRRRNSNGPILPVSGMRTEPRLSDPVSRLLAADGDPRSGARPSSGVPVYPGDSSVPSLWKNAPEKPEPALPQDAMRWRPRAPRT
jgi:hypothetical protein